MDLGGKLKQLRALEGISQQKVADFLGCKRQTYTRYENNQREVDFETLCKLADFFDVTTDFLLGRKDF